MAIRMNAALRRRLAGSALGALIAFAAVPAATAQWLPPWRAAASSADIAGRLEAQGFLLIAPLQRRPGVYLADVRGGPTGYQRLVVDDRSGEILERFIAPPRSFGPGFAARYDRFAQPSPPGVVQPSPGPGFSDEPEGGATGKSAYGGPTNVHIPSAISPYGSQPAPGSTKPKPQPPSSARKTPPAQTAPAAVPPTVTPVPPPAPREAAKPEESAPPASTPEPKTESPAGETENASRANAPAPESAPDSAKPLPEAQAQPQDRAPTPVKPAEPASSAEASDKSKTRIVPPALFE